MKKQFAGITLLLIITFALVIYGYWYIINSANNLLEVVDHLEKKVRDNQWSQALDKASLLDKKWNKTERVWAPLADHADIDKLETSITKVTKLIELKRKNRALTEIAIVKKLVKHIPEAEQLTIKNIF